MKKPFETVCPICNNLFRYCVGISCENCTDINDCEKHITIPKCNCDIISVLNALQSQIITLEEELNYKTREEQNGSK